MEAILGISAVKHWRKGKPQFSTSLLGYPISSKLNRKIGPRIQSHHYRSNKSPELEKLQNLVRIQKI